MKVKFVPQNVEFEILPGQSVMHVAQDHELYIKSVCKGVPSCAECRVRVVDGEHNVLPPGTEELSLIGTGHFIDRRRLSCQLKCFGDITIDLTEQIAKQQGLIGGQKKRKLAIKDDRIEDARAIRSESNVDEEMRDEEARSEQHLEEGDEANEAVVENSNPQNQRATSPPPVPRGQPSQQRPPQPHAGAGTEGQPGEARGPGGGGRRRRRRGGRGRDGGRDGGSSGSGSGGGHPGGNNRPRGNQ